MAEKTNWQKVSDQMTKLKRLHKRMDESRDLAYMSDFHLVTLDGKSYVPNVVNHTDNCPVTYADAVISDLQTASWQTKVEGDIPQQMARDIEVFIDDNFEQADEGLNNQFGIPSLYGFHCNHVCIRSVIGTEWLSQVDKNNNYLLKVLPIDMRWCAYMRGLNGLSFVAPIFFTNSDDINEEAMEKGWDKHQNYPKLGLPDNTDFVLVDFWDGGLNEVWVSKGDNYEVSASGNKIFDQKNTLTYPPFVIIQPATGFMLRDKGYIEHEAEDIFYKNRKMYKAINEAMTIERTIARKALHPYYERETEDYDSEPALPVGESGEVRKVPKGEIAQPVPLGDMNRASLTAKEDIYRRIELGGVSDAELGSARLDRPGIWFAKQFEIRHKLERARFEALAMMKEGLARMMIKQFIENAGDGELLVGRTGRRNRFTPKMLGDPDTYRISFRWDMSSKEMEIVNLAQAQAARGLVPDRIIIRDILKAEDPAGWERELGMQKAKDANPAISLLQMSVKFAEESQRAQTEVEANLLDMQCRIILQDYILQMKARMAPPMPEESGNGKKQPDRTAANMQGLLALPGLLGGKGMNTPKNEPQEVTG